MANRTFKQYGQAYAAKGDVSVVVSVAGTTVFNGNVSDSSTVRSGEPKTENLLYSFTMDESITGSRQVSITVTGGELCMGPTKYNGWDNKEVTYDELIEAGMRVDLDASKIWNSDGTEGDASVYTAKAKWASDQLKDKLSTEDYNAMQAGTKSDALATAWNTANAVGDKDFSLFAASQKPDRSNLKVNGSALDDGGIENFWPVLQDGDILTYDWDIQTWNSST